METKWVQSKWGVCGPLHSLTVVSHSIVAREIKEADKHVFHQQSGEDSTPSNSSVTSKRILSTLLFMGTAQEYTCKTSQCQIGDF